MSIYKDGHNSAPAPPIPPPPRLRCPQQPTTLRAPTSFILHHPRSHTGPSVLPT